MDNFKPLMTNNTHKPNRKILVLLVTCLLMVLLLMVRTPISATQAGRFYSNNFYQSAVYPVIQKGGFVTNDPIEMQVKKMFENLPKNKTKSGFLETLLIVVYNFPLYESIPLIEETYRNIFAKVLTCGSPAKGQMKPDIEVEIASGILGYKCPMIAMKIYSNFPGYMVVSDDMVVNWWNFHNLPKHKIWRDFAHFTQKVNRTSTEQDGWWWWNETCGFTACKAFHKSFLAKSNTDNFINQLYRTYLSSCSGEACCGSGQSDVYYIPARYKRCFMELSNMSASDNLFLEIAVPLILGSCDEQKNHILLKSLFIVANQKELSKADLLFWKSYNTNYHYVHSIKYSRDKEFGGNNIKVFKAYYLRYSKVIRGDIPSY